MGSKTRSKFRIIAGGISMRTVAVAASLAAFTGCHQLNNPWKDSSASIDAEMTTASAEGFKDKTEFYVPLHRRGETMQVCYENGAVTHFPLWFEDPFEDKGNDVTDPNDRSAPDNQFVVNWVDYLDIAYGPGRAFFVNGAMWPISAIVTPPGLLLESDGRISKGILWYDHDAEHSDPWKREAPDANHLGNGSELKGGPSSATESGATTVETTKESTGTN